METAASSRNADVSAPSLRIVMGATPLLRAETDALPTMLPIFQHPRAAVRILQSKLESSMKKMLVLFLFMIAANGFAQEKEGPCKQVKEACEKAGFVKGEAKEGYGLWVDCIEPIMKGSPQPANAKKPLPPVSVDVVNACKAKHPNFGQGQPKPPKK